MINQNSMHCQVQRSSWQDALSQSVTDPEKLLKRLDLDDQWLAPAKKAALLFGLRVPLSFVARMTPGDPRDPLLLQVLPLHAECDKHPDYSKDPLGEGQVNPVPGLLHKYKSRVLLTVAGACAINCRFCFRRHFDYKSNTSSPSHWQAAIDYIAADTCISEVIYSGGDPLVATDKTLATLTEALANIPHVKRLRIHTRLPIVIPQRITNTLIEAVSSTRLQPVIVLHCNHAQEINSEVTAAIKRLRAANINVFNQTVLLKDINDCVDTLADLSERLFEIGVMPYYLHALDKVEGVRHFDVPRKRALDLYAGLQARLSGYLVPRFVEEVSGEHSKRYMVNE